MYRNVAQNLFEEAVLIKSCKNIIGLSIIGDLSSRWCPRVVCVSGVQLSALCEEHKLKDSRKKMEWKRVLFCDTKCALSCDS